MAALGRLALRQAAAQHSARLSLGRAASSVAASSPASSVSLPPLDNIEASWKHLTAGEQEAVYKHLEELQKQDWKQLSLQEKKAAYYVSFGPHGPREPVVPAGTQAKIFAGTLASIGAAVAIFLGIRSFGSKAPTVNKEWQEATAEMAKEQKMNPFTGYSSTESAESLANR